MRIDRRSLQWRLLWQLTALFALATLVAIAAIAWQARHVAANVDTREINWRMDDIVRGVRLGTDQRLRVELSPALARVVGAPRHETVFAVRDRNGAVVGAEPAGLGVLAAGWPAAGAGPSYFYLDSFGPAARNYEGVTRVRETPNGPLMISVAVARHGDNFIHALLREFILDIAWIVPLVLGATLFVSIAVVRRGLRPLENVSRAAAGIGPREAGQRLPTADLPTELLPIVQAINQALGRLDEGIALLRRFTANAAHELRTPLAVLTAEVETIEQNGRLARVKEDLARMNRLVDQLLQVARLDNVALDMSAKVDLNQVAADVVAQMAPLAIAEGKSLSLDSCEHAVEIRGNPYALADALRNLVENAIAYAPPASEIVVEVDPNGAVKVADRGPGVALDERDRIFDRFWRGKGSTRQGSGLGLAIVSEIMKVHHGRVEVGDNPGGGTVFTLVFQELHQTTAVRQSG